MRTYDFSPLFRSTVGFDRVQRLLDAAMHADDQAQSYPPYNIEAFGEDRYRITMAVAGFSEDDLDITVKEQSLTVAGRAKKPGEDSVFLHHGIAGRSFERRFQLADHIKVKGAKLVNGLLHVELEREVPEEARPRKIDITSESPQVLEHKDEDSQKAA